MYEAHFGLQEKPFALTPDPAFLYRSRHHNYGLMSLEYGLVSRAGFCLLTGEVGSGKTLLIRQLLAGLGQEFRVGLISNTNRNLGGLLQWICLAFELDYRSKTVAQLYETFVNFLTSEYAAGRRALLIVDEAQNLGSPVLEELRVLSNVNADKNMVLQTILVGQPELRTILRTPAMRQFAQRISSDYHLPALRQADARDYVRHRLSVAGGSPTLIAPDAINLAWDFSGGIPRLINQLCDTALVYAFGEGLQQVDLKTMQDVVVDRKASGLWQGAIADTADA
jgi:type II secretory pathway predicted ATPase ExeA